MNKFYGMAGLRPSEVACAKGADSRQSAATPFRHLHGPSREGISGELPGSWHDYTPEEAVFAAQYAREQMLDAAHPMRPN